MTAATVTDTTGMASPALITAVSRLFAGAPGAGRPTVGIELELIPVRRGARFRSPVPVEELASALHDVPWIAFEPGGQVELNGPPEPTAAGAVTALADLWRRAADRLGTIDVGLLPAGLDPWRANEQLGLQLRSPRYVDMDRHFASVGPSGRSFMRQTASTQVCVGLAPGAAGAAQWRTANRLAPVLAAIFANAPLHEGRPLSGNGRRTAICRSADPGRSGHGLPWSGPDPVTEYTDFAARAEPISARFAGPEAVDAHLTTLFPPVRPRGTYLEIRAVEALPLAEVASLVTMATVLLADPDAGECAAEAVAGSGLEMTELWDLAAGAGVRDPHLRRVAMTVIGVATAALEGFEPGYLPDDAPARLGALQRRVTNGQAPGDALRRRLACRSR